MSVPKAAVEAARKMERRRGAWSECDLPAMYAREILAAVAPVVLEQGSLEPPVGSVVRCTCGCYNVWVRGLNGWHHVMDDDNGNNPGWWINADEPHELLHCGPERAR